MDVKSIFLSKTAWVAFLMFLVGGFAVLQTSYPTLGWVIMVKAVLDIILRLLSTQPVSLTAPVVPPKSVV